MTLAYQEYYTVDDYELWKGDWELIEGMPYAMSPDLVMEVVSSSSTKRDEQMKFELYQREGVPYYVLVYPDKQLAKAYYHQPGKYQKLADYSSEKSDFEVGNCSLKVDFGAVWR